MMDFVQIKDGRHLKNDQNCVKDSRLTTCSMCLIFFLVIVWGLLSDMTFPVFANFACSSPGPSYTILAFFRLFLPKCWPKYDISFVKQKKLNVISQYMP